MDGRQRRVDNSLQGRLSLWVSLAIVIVASIAGIFAFSFAYHEAEELQDDLLRQFASFLVRHKLSVSSVGELSEDVAHDRENRVFVQWLSSAQESTSSSAGDSPLPLPANLHDGLQTVQIAGAGYRVLVTATGSGERLVLAQQTSVRDEIVHDSGLLTLMPFLILVPILLLLIADMIRRIFAPVAELAQAIDQRGDEDLQPIAAGPLPAEIQPFVLAINRLLRRVEQSVEAQRRFVADAAHELRSPLTALSLQAERLAAAEISGEARQRLQTLRQGIERGRALLDQLLALARAQTSAVLSPEAVSVQQIYRSVLEDLLPMAECKSIDIGVVGSVDFVVPANEFDLATLVRNLVGNAIRYTPAGGRVDLSVASANGETVLVIEDNGPGIPEAERDRVFDPFYRVLGSGEVGSGLGLSIVRTIALRLGASLRLGFADDRSRSGLRATVTFRT